MNLGKSPNAKVIGDQHLRIFWKRMWQKHDIGSKVLDTRELAWLSNHIMGHVSWICHELNHIIGSQKG
jgi:hypothetical protein